MDPNSPIVVVVGYEGMISRGGSTRAVARGTLDGRDQGNHVPWFIRYNPHWYLPPSLPHPLIDRSEPSPCTWHSSGQASWAEFRSFTWSLAQCRSAALRHGGEAALIRFEFRHLH